MPAENTNIIWILNFNSVSDSELWILSVFARGLKSDLWSVLFLLGSICLSLSLDATSLKVSSRHLIGTLLLFRPKNRLGSMYWQMHTGIYVFEFSIYECMQIIMHHQNFSEVQCKITEVLFYIYIFWLEFQVVFE